MYFIKNYHSNITSLLEERLELGFAVTSKKFFWKFLLTFDISPIKYPSGNILSSPDVIKISPSITSSFKDIYFAF